MLLVEAFAVGLIALLVFDKLRLTIMNNTFYMQIKRNYIGIGIAIGVALGIAMRKLAMGIAIGLAIGFLLNFLQNRNRE